MISDEIHSTSIAVGSSNHKDFSKKKRFNRTAKLKQCKLDARREQWLSQVKLKGASKNEMNVACREKLGHLEKQSVHLLDKLEIKSRGDEDGSSMQNCSDTDSSPSNSPISCVSGSNHSGTNFTTTSRSCSSRSSSISSNGDKVDADEDECLDDWEALADSPLISSPSNKHGNSAESGSCLEVQRPPASSRAWMVDDAFRPQCLPDLSKQCSLGSNSERQLGFGRSSWDCRNGLPEPTSCPICFEDLDCTDSSFLPCLCGFKLCLFCHKRIREDDGRCPGCRKQYDHDLVEGETAFDGRHLIYRFARSSTMIMRS